MASPGQKPIENPKEETFAREYSRHGNRQRALISAGYTVRTWVEHKSTSSSVLAGQLLKKDHVRRRIQFLQENRARKADFTELKVLRELRRVALFDIRKLYNEAGELKRPSEWDADTAAAVSGMDVEKLFGVDDNGRRAHVGYTVKVKTNDKLSALEKLMRYFGMVEAPPAEPASTIIENQQVNIYLPENPRHAKIISNGHAHQSHEGNDLEAQYTSAEGVQLPAKRTNGSH